MHLREDLVLNSQTTSRMPNQKNQKIIQRNTEILSVNLTKTVTAYKPAGLSRKIHFQQFPSTAI